MVFPNHGNHFSKEFVLRRISQIGRDFRVISSRKMLRNILKESRREVVKINSPLLVRQRREKERILVIRVTMMKDHKS
jgi:hypothetical protein